MTTVLNLFIMIGVVVELDLYVYHDLYVEHADHYRCLS
jgi:hypothetical protein